MEDKASILEVLDLLEDKASILEVLDLLEDRANTLEVLDQLGDRANTLEGLDLLEDKASILVALDRWEDRGNTLADQVPTLELSQDLITTLTPSTRITLTALAGMAGHHIANRYPFLVARIATSAMQPLP